MILTALALLCIAVYALYLFALAVVWIVKAGWSVGVWLADEWDAPKRERV